MNSSNKFGSINQNFDKHIDDKNSSVDLKDPDIILDFSAVNYIDTNGVSKFNQDNFIKILYRMNLLEKFDQHLFISIDDVVKILKK